MKRKVILSVFMVVFALGLVNCSPKAPPETMYTPQERAERNAAAWLHIWNSQFEDHKYMSGLPNLTNQQKVILNRKADLLGKSKPLLDSYVRVVRSGGMPSTMDEQQLTQLMNELSQMALSFAPK